MYSSGNTVLSGKKIVFSHFVLNSVPLREDTQYDAINTNEEKEGSERYESSTPQDW